MSNAEAAGERGWWSSRSPSDGARSQGSGWPDWKINAPIGQPEAELARWRYSASTLRTTRARSVNMTSVV